MCRPLCSPAEPLAHPVRLNPMGDRGRRRTNSPHTPCLPTMRHNLAGSMFYSISIAFPAIPGRTMDGQVASTGYVGRLGLTIYATSWTIDREPLTSVPDGQQTNNGQSSHNDSVAMVSKTEIFHGVFSLSHPWRNVLVYAQKVLLIFSH